LDPSRFYARSWLQKPAIIDFPELRRAQALGRAAAEWMSDTLVMPVSTPHIE
jgi:hypothetical protein